MSEIAREQATANADMPHHFEDDGTESCSVCQTSLGDQRHTVWQHAADASRERASETGLPREFGTAL
jgi:hypothetical protein